MPHPVCMSVVMAVATQLLNQAQPLGRPRKMRREMDFTIIAGRENEGGRKNDFKRRGKREDRECGRWVGVKSKERKRGRWKVWPDVANTMQCKPLSTPFNYLVISSHCRIHQYCFTPRIARPASILRLSTYSHFFFKFKNSSQNTRNYLQFITMFSNFQSIFCT